MPSHMSSKTQQSDIFEKNLLTPHQVYKMELQNGASEQELQRRLGGRYKTFLHHLLICIQCVCVYMHMYICMNFIYCRLLASNNGSDTSFMGQTVKIFSVLPSSSQAIQ